MTIMLNRLMPLLHSEDEARDFLGKVARSMRDFGRREGGAVTRLAWHLETDPFRGTHMHGALVAPRVLMRRAQRFMRAAIERRTGLDHLPPRSLHFHTQRGPATPEQARGWCRYCAKQAVPQGQEIAGVRGAADPTRRAIQGRRVGLPRFPGVTTPIVAPVVILSAQHPLRITRSTTAAQPARFTMPVPNTTPRKRNRLRGLRVSEVSLCGTGQNKHARVVVAKSDDDAGAAVAVEVIEVDGDERRIGGWAYVTEIDGEEVEDSEGDTIDLATLREAAEGFIAESRRGALRHGKDHSVIVWTQSVIVDADLKRAWGVKLNRTGWWLSGVVQDDEVWERVKSGELRSLSIGGTAARVPVEKNRTAGRAMTLEDVLRIRGQADRPALPVHKARRVTAPAGSPASRPGWTSCKPDCPDPSTCKAAGRCGMELRRKAAVSKAEAVAARGQELVQEEMRRRNIAAAVARGVPRAEAVIARGVQEGERILGRINSVEYARSLLRNRR